VEVYKTHDKNISRILKAHYTLTYVMPNFVFPLFCVSTADVDFWVNGGWDQPKCPKAIYILAATNILFKLLGLGKIYNF
jgi:hypothetical protein